MNPRGLPRRSFLAGSLVLPASFVLAQVPTTLAPREALDAARAGTLLLIDIRTPEEWRDTGLAQGAIALDVETPAFEVRLAGCGWTIAASASPDRPQRRAQRLDTRQARRPRLPRHPGGARRHARPRRLAGRESCRWRLIPEAPSCSGLTRASQAARERACFSALRSWDLRCASPENDAWAQLRLWSFNKSGRRSRVIRSASARRHFAMRAWSPESSASGRPGPPIRADGCSADIRAGRSRSSRPRRTVLAHHAGDQPHAGIEQDQRRHLAAREDVVADRDLGQPAPLDHPLVDTLETSADDDDALARHPVAHLALRQRPPARRHQQPRARITGRERRRRSPRPAHRSAAPSPPRRRPDCRRHCGAGRCRGRGSGASPATRAPAQSLPRQRHAERPGNISG